MTKDNKVNKKVRMLRNLEYLRNIATTLLSILACIWANIQLIYLIQSRSYNIFLYIFCVCIDIFCLISLVSFMKKIVKKF